MTQIQALENLSQTDLVKLIQTERQQHADDMDMLSKELASRAAPVAIQAQWIEHCNITDIPDAVLTPSGLAIKNEQADTQEPIAWVVSLDGRSLQSSDFTHDVMLTISGDFESDDQRRAYSRQLAEKLSKTKPAVVGAQEPDQALLISMACCQHHGFGLLSKNQQDSMLQEMRKLWDEVMGHGYYSPTHRGRYTAMLARAVKESLTLDMRCTCPSGDGSLRWPCPVHPPKV